MTSPVHEILAVGDQHFQGKIISDGALQTKSGGVIFPDNSIQLTAATGSAISSVFGRTGVVIAASGDYTWGQIDKATSSLADITTRPHSALTSVGANDHHNQSHDNTDHSMATPAIILGSAAAAGVATSLIRSDATIAAFDATVPGTIGIGDTAATGSIAFAARRDHTHGSPSTWTATVHNLLSSIHGDTTAASATRGDLITAQGASPKWARLAVGASAGMFIRSDATDIGWSTLKLPNAATANYITYATAANTLGESANLQYDGSDFIIGSGTRARMASQNRFRFLNSMAKVYSSSDPITTISDNVWTTLDYDTEEIDTDTLHDPSTNPSRFTVALTGKYCVLAFARFAANATPTVGVRQIRILINGSVNGVAGFVPPATTGTAAFMSLFSLTATDYVQMQVLQNSGNTMDIAGGSGTTWFAIIYLGE